MIGLIMLLYLSDSSVLYSVCQQLGSSEKLICTPVTSVGYRINTLTFIQCAQSSYIQYYNIIKFIFYDKLF